MEILKLAGSLTHMEFKQALNDIALMNYLGIIREYVEHFDSMVDEGTEVNSALHYAQYDMIINPDTGKYKKELESKIEAYEKITNY